MNEDINDLNISVYPNFINLLYPTPYMKIFNCTNICTLRTSSNTTNGDTANTNGTDNNDNFIVDIMDYTRSNYIDNYNDIINTMYHIDNNYITDGTLDKHWQQLHDNNHHGID